MTEETVDLTWQPPRSDGGLPISSYIIEVREIHRNTWHMMCEVKSRYTTYTITGLVPGVQYLFRISAKNDEGQGPPLIGEQPVKPFKAACEYYICEHKSKILIFKLDSIIFVIANNFLYFFSFKSIKNT